MKNLEPKSILSTGDEDNPEQLAWDKHVQEQPLADVLQNRCS